MSPSRPLCAAGLDDLAIRDTIHSAVFFHSLGGPTLKADQ